MASYEFSKLPDDLSEALNWIIDRCGPLGEGVIPGAALEGMIRELQELGFISEARFYLNGECMVRVAPRGMRYFEELAVWEAEREAERRKAEDESRRASRREWAIGIVGALATLLSGLVGYLIGLSS